jgi:hypothetical protein
MRLRKIIRVLTYTKICSMIVQVNELELVVGFEEAALS